MTFNNIVCVYTEKKSFPNPLEIFRFIVNPLFFFNQ